MSEAQERQLNNDFNHNMYLAKSMLAGLDSITERQNAVLWMKKLSMCSNSLAEQALRNNYMYYLVVNIQNRKLCPPFIASPPMGPLPTIGQMTPGGCKEDKKDDPFSWDNQEEEGSKRRGPPILYSQSPDGGAFLNAQPIPRKGAFCYLAVVTKAVED